MNAAPIALDLFAGTGWCVACKALGIREYGVDNMPEVVATREQNGMPTIFRDVWTGLEDTEFVPQHDLLIASPPCQTFSMAGSGSGRRALDNVMRLIHDNEHLRGGELRASAERRGLDPRTALVLSPLAYAMRHRPRFIAWEQVPTVLPVWEACAEMLREAGYSVWTGNLHAEQYGVPQTRKRAFLIASREREAKPPAPTHSRYHSRDPKRLDPGVLPWVSMAEALGWGPTERPSPTITGGGTETGGAEPIAKLARYTSRDDFLPNGGDASWVHNRPSPTIVGSFRPDIVAAPGYRKPGDPPRQKTPGSVRITPAEAAILQSFPDGFQFAGSKSKQFLQIGNAVPPQLAHAILKQFAL